MLIETPTPVAIACAEPFSSHDFRPALSRIKIPSLLIHGTLQMSAPLGLTGEAPARLQHERLIVVARAPHGLYETDAVRVNLKILAFADSA